MIGLGEPGLKIGCYFICVNQYVRELDKMKKFKNLITDLVLSDCKKPIFSKTHLVLKKSGVRTGTRRFSKFGENHPIW